MCSLLLVISGIGFASEDGLTECTDGGSSGEFETEVLKLVSDVMEYTILPQKELCGFESVNFSCLYLGSEIPAYILRSEGIVPCDIHYDPLISEVKWAGIVEAYYDFDGNVTVKVDSVSAKTDACPEIGKDEIAIVFTDTVCYLCCGEEWIPAETYERIEDRISLDEYQGETAVRTECVLPQQELSVEENQVKTLSATAKNVSVPSVVQKGKYTCWAACVTSISNYYGTSVTESDVWSYVGITNGDTASAGRSAADAAKVLAASKFGSLSYSGSNGDGSFYSTMNLDYASNSIDNGWPIFAAFYNSSRGHTVVISGYVVVDNTTYSIVYMDPTTGHFPAYTGNVQKESPMTITSDGEIYSFFQGFASHK